MMEEIKTKVCTKCKNEFPSTTEYFYADIRNKSGLRGLCINCNSESNSKSYKKNKEYYEEYRKKNKVKIKEANYKYRKKNKEYFEEYRKKYYQENKEKALKYSRENSPKHVDALSDTYIKSRLGGGYFTPQMIETKRLSLQLKRAIGNGSTIAKTRTIKNKKPDYMQCSSCGKEKEYNNENFYKLSNSKYGLRNKCKSCCSEDCRIRHKLKTNK